MLTECTFYLGASQGDEERNIYSAAYARWRQTTVICTFYRGASQGDEERNIYSAAYVRWRQTTVICTFYRGASQGDEERNVYSAAYAKYDVWSRLLKQEKTILIEQACSLLLSLLLLNLVNKL